MWSVSADPLKFEEAIRWFEGKVPLLPGEFKQLEAEARRRAFTMAGIAELDRMAWLHQTLLEAIEKGQTLDEWRKRVRERVTNRHPFHLETVFRTNVQSAYSAGRWAQLNHPAVRKARPFWMYDAILDARTTETCKHRHGTVLPADDPWWRENWPPLHFNCRSGVRSLTPEQAKARGVASRPPETKPPQDGFGLPPDAEDWADTYARGLRSRINVPWERYFDQETHNWLVYGLPEIVAGRPVPRRLFPPSSEVGKDKIRDLFTELVGKLPAYLLDPTGLPVIIDSRLLDHLIHDGRERYLAWLPDLIQDPEEIWLVPMRRKGGRRVVFRQIYLKVYQYSEGGKRRLVIFVAEFHRGVFVGLTLHRADVARLNKRYRIGFLRYVKK